MFGNLEIESSKNSKVFYIFSDLNAKIQILDNISFCWGIKAQYSVECTLYTVQGRISTFKKLECLSNLWLDMRQKEFMNVTNVKECNESKNVTNVII